MKLRQIAYVLIFFCLTFTLYSCAKTPSGTRYSKSDENMQNACDFFDLAWENNNSLTDIEYEIALMGSVSNSGNSSEFGIKNIFQIKDKHSENMQAYNANTYYGTSYNIVNTYYRKDGNIYTSFYDTFFSSQISNDDFFDFVKQDVFYNDSDIFNPTRFSTTVNYFCSGNKNEIVFSDANTELADMIASAIGFDTTEYVYSVDDIQMTVFINKNKQITDIIMTFKVPYHTLMGSNSLTYEGNFRYKLVNSSSEFNIKTPTTTVKYESISSISLIRHLFKGYEVLSTIQNLDADYKRAVKNTDIENRSSYFMENNVRFTQKYLEDNYLYGSIDYEHIKIPGEEKKSSAGIFIDGNQYKYRDTSGKSEDKENTTSPDDLGIMIYETLSSELILEADINNVKISETDTTITFTYSYKDDILLSYGEYLLSTFKQSSENILTRVTGMNKNIGKITVSKIDSCIISHTIEFSVYYNYNILLETQFEMTINSTGENVDILNLEDWNQHIG